MISSYELDSEISRLVFTSHRENGLSSGYRLDVYTNNTDTRERLVEEVSLTGRNAGEYSFGSEYGISLENGLNYTSSSYGATVTSVDPIIDLLKKTVIVSNSTSSLYREIANRGDISKDTIVFLSITDLTEANRLLSKGDVEGYCNIMMGLDNNEGNNVKLYFHNIDTSPIIKSLKDSGAIKYGSGDMTNKESLFHVRGGVAVDTMQTVQDIFTKILAPLGLELYWTGDNRYSLESPRLANDNSPSLATIEEDEIISLSITSNPYDTPSLIFPAELETEIIGSPASAGMGYILSAGVLNAGNKKNRSMKIETYQIPSFLVEPLKNASYAAKDAINSTYGAIATMTTDEVRDKYQFFYGSFARKTSLYERNSGSCTTIFNPSLTIPYAWYTIAGKEMFVSSIIHDISRTKATTLLTVLGIRDNNKEEVSVGDSGVSNLKEAEDKEISSIIDRAKISDSTYINNIARDIEKRTTPALTSMGTHHDAMGSGMSEAELYNVFGDEEKESSEIGKVKEVHPIINEVAKEK